MRRFDCKVSGFLLRLMLFICEKGGGFSAESGESVFEGEWFSVASC